MSPTALSGFLGAGKTTTMMAERRQLQSRGRRVAVITNDQGSVLAAACARADYLIGHAKVTVATPRGTAKASIAGADQLASLDLAVPGAVESGRAARRRHAARLSRRSVAAASARTRPRGPA